MMTTVYLVCLACSVQGSSSGSQPSNSFLERWTGVYTEGPIWPVLFETFAKNRFIRWKWSPLKQIAAKMRTYPAWKHQNLSPEPEPPPPTKHGCRRARHGHVRMGGLDAQKAVTHTKLSELILLEKLL